MSRVLVGLPPNVSRKTSADLSAMFPGIDVMPPRTHQEDHDYMHGLFCRRDIPFDDYPEIIISPDPEIHGSLEWISESGYFEKFTGGPQNLSTFISSYIDPVPCEYIRIIGIIPVIIIYNRNCGVEIKSWTDLYRIAQNGRIITPPEDTPLPPIYRHYMNLLLGEKAELVFEKTDHLLYPLDINKAVDEGEYDAGVLIPAFSRNSRLGNVLSCYPEEGAIALPIAILKRRGATVNCDGIIDHLLSHEYQEYLSVFGDMIPALPEVPLPGNMPEDIRLIWGGWDLFKKFI